MPLENLPMVLAHGILSYERAAQLPHRSVAMNEIQERRDSVQVPNGLKLHQYANLYFHARNPMMYVRRAEAGNLCVLRVLITIFTDIDGIVITDCNAASDYVRFLAPSQLRLLDLDAIYARSWNHANEITKKRHKSQKCAEVLVPHCIPVSFIAGAYVVNADAYRQLAGAGFTLPIKIEPDIFFG